MLVFWWFANKHDFRSFEGIFFVKSKLQRVFFSSVHSAFDTSKGDVPDVSRLVDYYKLENVLKLCRQILCFSYQSLLHTLAYHLNFYSYS